MNRLLRIGKLHVGLLALALGLGFTTSAWAGNGSSGGSSGGSNGGSSGGYRSHRLFGGGSSGGYYSHGSSGGSSGGYRSGGSSATQGVETESIESESARAARRSAVLLTILVPAGAKLYIEDQPTQLTGTLRQFISPKLEPDKEYIYTLKADVENDGQKISGKEELRVKAGDHATVEFTPSPENSELLVAGSN
jgi:uncharacterized protein (TIGR03000 family)